VTAPVAPGGDPLVRDRLGNRTYHLCVVVDDARHGVDLVIRGQDLLDATPLQLRLAAALGRVTPPAHLHHPLVLRPDGSKLSKAAGDTAVGALLDAGARPADLLGLAAALAGLVDAPRPIEADALGTLFGS
jgi:glutamyl/glutaminyl-tRNA synthetase